MSFNQDYDRKFFGVYPGKCVDSSDPKGKGRVRLQVPQVTGQAVTEWAFPIGGAIAQINYPYGTFYTNASQTVTAANTATVANNWVEDDTNKTHLDGTKLYVEESGDYMLQFSAVMSKSNANAQDADIWIRKNGVDLENSDTVVTLSGSSGHSVVTVALILDLEANDYIEFVFSGVSTSTSLQYHAAGSSPTRPACPGIIATLSLIGKYRPQPGTPVWVSYIGGDPNFPVWTGAM